MYKYGWSWIADAAVANRGDQASRQSLPEGADAAEAEIPSSSENPPNPAQNPAAPLNFVEILSQANSEFVNRVHDLFATMERRNAELVRRDAEATDAWREIAGQLYGACQSLAAAICVPFDF